MKHILMVDDENDIREILRHVFMAAGYRVTDVASVAEAMQVVLQDPPDLILTDLQLEEADGFAVIEEVKRVAPTIPVILLTGVFFDPAMIRRFEAEKIVAYIEKTAPLERILRVVKEHLA
jgi:DNA-binding NtrC family response regulator